MDSVEVMELVHNTLANLRDGFTLSWNALDANEQAIALKVIESLSEELAEAEAKADRAIEDACFVQAVDMYFNRKWQKGAA